MRWVDIILNGNKQSAEVLESTTGPFTEAFTTLLYGGGENVSDRLFTPAGLIGTNKEPASSNYTISHEGSEISIYACIVNKELRMSRNPYYGSPSISNDTYSYAEQSPSEPYTFLAFFKYNPNVVRLRFISVSKTNPIIVEQPPTITTLGKIRLEKTGGAGANQYGIITDWKYYEADEPHYPIVTPIPPKPDTAPIAGLFFNKSEKNKVDKELEDIGQYRVTLNSPTDLMNPVIDIMAENADYLIKNVNYVYMSAFERWYFVTSIEILRTNLIRIRCRVDVLYSFREQIKKQKAIIARNEENYNLLLDDQNFEFQANPVIKTKRFPNNKVFLNNNSRVEQHFVLVLV